MWEGAVTTRNTQKAVVITTTIIIITKSLIRKEEVGLEATLEIINISINISKIDMVGIGKSPHRNIKGGTNIRNKNREIIIKGEDLAVARDDD